MAIYDSPEYEPERADTIIERARSLAVYFSDYLPECGAQHPEGKYNVFDNSGWCYREYVISCVQQSLHSNFYATGSFLTVIHNVAEYKYKPLWEYDPPSLGGWIPPGYAQSIYYHRDLKYHISKAILFPIWRVVMIPCSDHPDQRTSGNKSGQMSSDVMLSNGPT
jgi:hypothetical protein